MKSDKSKAASADTDPQQLATLARSEHVAARRVVAKNERTPPEVLDGLSHDSDKATRQAVAGNPNAPANALIRLGAQFPGQLLGNPALDALVIENPNLFSEIPEATLTSIAKRESCPTELLGHLARAGHGKGLLLSLAQNGNTPSDAVHYLHSLSAPQLAQRFNAPEDQMRKVKDALAQHFQVRGEADPEESRQLAWEALVWRVLKADANDIGDLVEHAIIPKRVKDDLIGWTLHLRGVVAACKALKLPASLLEAIASQSDKRDLKLVQKCAGCPAWIRGVGTAAEARLAIEANREASEDLWQQATASGSDALMLALAAHPLAKGRIDAGQTLDRLAREASARGWQCGEGDTDWRSMSFICTHRMILPETLVFLYESVCVRDRTLPLAAEIFSLIAEHPNTPMHVLRELVERGEQLVASNPRADADLLRAIYATVPNTERALSENPVTPPDILAALTKSEDLEVLSTLLRNPSTPPDALLHILKKKDALEILDFKGTEPALLAHPNLSGPVIDVLINRSLVDTYAKGAVLASDRRLSERSYERLARIAGQTAIQKQLASNPAVPIGIVERLASHKDQSVKKAALRSLKQRAS
jgi:hypothetical protein